MLHGETWEVQLGPPWDWDMAAGHCGASRQESALHCIEEDLVMKPRTGKQLLEHSGGEWPGWQWPGWAWKIAKDLESPVQKCTIWKPLWSDTVYIYIYLFISLASRVYSLNSLNSVSPAFAADSNKKSEAGPALLWCQIIHISGGAVNARALKGCHIFVKGFCGSCLNKSLACCSGNIHDKFI